MHKLVQDKETGNSNMNELNGSAQTQALNHMVIFLDIDGVLCINDPDFRTFRKDKVALLDELVEKLNAVIVVSSAWRVGRTVVELRDLFQAQGCKCYHRIIGKTVYEGNFRGEQILEYVDRYTIPEYIVIDDETFDMDNLPDQSRIYKTKGLFFGLDQELVDKIISERT